MNSKALLSNCFIGCFLLGVSAFAQAVISMDSLVLDSAQLPSSFKDSLFSDSVPSTQQGLVLDSAMRVDSAQPSVVPVLAEYTVTPIKPATKEPIPVGLFLSPGMDSTVVLQLGVLDAIEKYKIKIDYLAASGWSSVLAVLWAYGYTPDSIYEILQKDSLLYAGLLASTRAHPQAGCSQRVDKSNQVPLLEPGVMDYLPGFIWKTGLRSSHEELDFMAPCVQTDWSTIVQLRLEYWFTKAPLYGKPMVPVRVLIANGAQSVIISDSLPTSLDVVRSLPQHPGLGRGEFALVRYLNHSIHESIKDSLGLKHINWIVADAIATRQLESKSLVTQMQHKQMMADLKDSLLVIRPHSLWESSITTANLRLMGFGSVRERIMQIGDWAKDPAQYATLRVSNSLYDQASQSVGAQSAGLDSTEAPRLVLENVPSVVQRHLRDYFPDSLNAKEFLDGIQKAQNSKLYSNLEGQWENQEQPLFVLEAQSNSLFEAGAGAAVYDGFGHILWGGVRVHTVQQLEFDLHLQGLYGRYLKGVQGQVLMQTGPYSGFYGKYSPQFYKANMLGWQQEAAIRTDERIITQNTNKHPLELGWKLRGGKRYYSEILFDMSSYYTGFMQSVDNQDLYSNSLGLANTKNMHITFGMGQHKPWLSEVFATSGYGYDVRYGFLANSISQKSIVSAGMGRNEAPLFQRASFHWRWMESFSFLAAGMDVKANMDASGVESGLVLPDSLALITGELVDPVLDRMHQQSFAPTLYSTRYFMAEYYGHAYIHAGLRLFFGHNSNGLWVFPSYLVRIDGYADEYFQTPNQMAVVEVLLRAQLWNIDWVAGIENNQYNADRYDSWGDSWRYFVQIGKIDF